MKKVKRSKRSKRAKAMKKAILERLYPGASKSKFLNAHFEVLV